MKNKRPQLSLLFISIACYVFALLTTLFTAKGTFFGYAISNTDVSFTYSIQTLINEGHIFLAYSLIVFVLALPTLKYVAILFNIFGITVINKKINGHILTLQKFAMVDVFIIAILLVGSKPISNFEIIIREGTYALLFSVITGIISTLVISSNYSKKKN